MGVDFLNTNLLMLHRVKLTALLKYHYDTDRSLLTALSINSMGHDMPMTYVNSSGSYTVMTSAMMLGKYVSTASCTAIMDSLV